MNQVTVTAPTVQLAIDSALEKLNTTEDQVDVTVIDAGKKGFLGFGSRMAVAKVTLKNVKPLDLLAEITKIEPAATRNVEVEDLSDQRETVVPAQEIEIEAKEEVDIALYVEEYVSKIVNESGYDINVQVKLEGKYCKIDLTGEKIAVFIGKRGQVLNALQYLVQLALNRVSNQYTTVLMDAENYRRRRREALKSLAHRMADRAVYSKRQVALEPMPSYERKVVHAILMEKKNIKTYSKGTDPNRHIVIVPNS